MFLILCAVLAIVCAATAGVSLPEQKDFVVHMSGSEKDVQTRLRSEGFALVKKWNVPEWYHVRCVSNRCASGNHQLRSAVNMMEPLEPLVRNHRSDWGYLQYYVTCKRFDNVMPYCQNVEAAWSDCINGTGTTVAVVDDGVDVVHVDLKNAIDLSRSIDINFGNPTPMPNYGDTHGTACAGIVSAAPGNGECSNGIAFGAKLVGIRLLAGWPTSAQEAEALSHVCESIDVYTNSWGPQDENQRLDGMPSATKAAIEHCLRVGRGGRGSVYVWAAGNGGRSAGNTNFDGYSNSRYTISVAAVTSEGRRPAWGEIGASNVIAAASSGGSLGIVTTLFTSYDKTACRDDFGGTSASSPQVAAIVALLLSSRSDLTWRDVRHLVVHSGQVVDPNNVDAPWFENAAGLKYSEAFGFGVIDAAGLVRRGKTHTLLPAEKMHGTTIMPTGSFRVLPGATKTYRWTITALTVANLSDIELRVHAHFEGHFYDMHKMTLISPHGDSVRLVRQHAIPDTDIAWTFTTPAFWGTAPQGEWRLEVINGPSGGGFYIDDVQMNLYGV